MSDTLDLEPIDPTRPNVEALRKMAVAHLQSALDAILAMGPAAPSPTWAGKVDRLRREISGERSVRVVHNSPARLDPVGPVVSIDVWCEQMLVKICAFRDEYLASQRESPDHFPLERTAADWAQELSLFTPAPAAETETAPDDDESGEETEGQAAA